MKHKYLSLLLLLFSLNVHSQNELKNWYFGTGVDGIRFVNNVPQKLSDKMAGVGFEGMIVVNDPLTGDLLFYSDGIRVVNKNHAIMTNGTGLTGNYSCSQSVQCCPVPGSCAKQFYLFTNSAWDNTPGAISYSIVDFTTDPLGIVTNKNTLVWNGPSDQAMCLVNKPNSNSYWLICTSFATATYYVWPLTPLGIGVPSVYTFSNMGDSYQMNYNKLVGKICMTGFVGNNDKIVTLIDFDANTGVLSNEVQLAGGYNGAAATRFSPDGSKLYAGLIADFAGNAPRLFQYDFNTGSWTDMNTCCYGHDLKLGPDGKMYFMHTFYGSQPLSVIDNPNLSAVGNACNYHTLTFTTAFTGDVRRFSETVILPTPVTANADVITLPGNTVNIPVLLNDSASNNDFFFIDSIITQPIHGIATIAGTEITYTTTETLCGITDTIIYRIKTQDCAIDTAIVLVNFPACPTCVSSLITIDTSICPGQSINGHVTTGTYSDTLISAGGCDSILTMHLTILPAMTGFTAGNDTTLCAGISLQLSAVGASTYNWTPVINLSNPNISNPIATPVNDVQYIVTGTSSMGCTARDTINISIKPLPIVETTNDTSFCKGSSVQLNTTGAVAYSWTPTTGLSNPSIANPIVTALANSQYIVTGISADGCSARDTINITVKPLPIVETNNDTSFCEGSSVQLNTTGAVAYSWTPTTGLSNPSIANPIATALASSQYIVTGISGNGCSARDTINITVKPLPIVETNNDTSFCKASSVQLNTTGAVVYSWAPITGLSNPSIANPIVTALASSQYIVTGISADGCSARDTINLSMLLPPVISKSNDTSICQNSSVQLFASGGVSYQWTPVNSINLPTSATPTVTPLNNTTYYVIVTGVNTCIGTDSVKVSFRQAPVFTVSPGQFVCTSNSVQLNAGGGDTYSWSPSQLVNNATIPNPLTNTNSTTTYSVLITESTCHISETLSTTITFFSPLHITASQSNDIDCSNSSSKLLANGADLYSWSPATGLSNSTVANPVASPANTQQYIVTGTNQDGCVGYDTIIVYVNYKNNTSGYYMPSAFTPNSDGTNDCYGIKYWGLIKKVEFSIFNRWGNKVFYSTDPSGCWDGNYGGQRAETGGYIYYIKATTACGSIERKGSFILIR